MQTKKSIGLIEDMEAIAERRARGGANLSRTALKALRGNQVLL